MARWNCYQVVGCDGMGQLPVTPGGEVVGVDDVLWSSRGGCDRGDGAWDEVGAGSCKAQEELARGQVAHGSHRDARLDGRLLRDVSGLDA